MISYVIAYRESSLDRLRNLELVLKWISSYEEDLDVIVVEQDYEPKLQLTGKFRFPVHTIFVRNNGLFNKSWAFNVGVKFCKSDIIFFGDGDLLVNKSSFKSAVKLLKNKKYQVVRPFMSCLDLDQATTESLNTEQLTFKGRPTREGLSICGGLTGFIKEALDQIRGWDERFEGWGGEDDYQSAKVKAWLKYCSLNGMALHLHHERSALNGSKQHPEYDNNRNRFKTFDPSSPPKLVEIGNIFKYSFL